MRNLLAEGTIMARKRGSKSASRKLSPEAEARFRELEAEQSRHEQMQERNIGRPCYRCGSPTKGFGDHYDEANDRMICWGCQMREVHERYLKEAVEKISLCPEDLGELASAKQRGFLILPRSSQRSRDLQTAYGAWCSAVGRPMIHIRGAAGREAAVTVEMWSAGAPLSEDELRIVAGLVSDGASPGREDVYAFPGASQVGKRPRSLGLREGRGRGDLVGAVDEARATGETLVCRWLFVVALGCPAQEVLLGCPRWGRQRRPIPVPDGTEEAHDEPGQIDRADAGDRGERRRA
jgi:hypothetical protein